MPKLTQKMVASLKAKDREYTAWDSEIPGFGVRVRPTGAMAYILQYRTQDRRKSC